MDRERETLETREGARKGEIRKRKKEGERVRGERGKCASEQKREREGDDGQRVRVTEKGREEGRKGEQSVERERERGVGEREREHEPVSERISKREIVGCTRHTGRAARRVASRRLASLKARAMGARRLERRQSVLNCLSTRRQPSSSSLRERARAVHRITPGFN